MRAKVLVDQFIVYFLSDSKNFDLQISNCKYFIFFHFKIPKSSERESRRSLEPGTERESRRSLEPGTERESRRSLEPGTERESRRSLEPGTWRAEGVYRETWKVYLTEGVPRET